MCIHIDSALASELMQLVIVGGVHKHFIQIEKSRACDNDNRNRQFNGEKKTSMSKPSKPEIIRAILYYIEIIYCAWKSVVTLKTFQHCKWSEKCHLSSRSIVRWIACSLNCLMTYNAIKHRFLSIVARSIIYFMSEHHKSQ